MTSPSPTLQALRFATKAHAGQSRTSGEPFINHLTAVADMLKSIYADEETLTAALLHDTIEDTAVTAAQLKKEFGPVVTRLVEGVTKVEQLEKTFDKQTRNMESVRKMFRTMGRDIRVLFIKLADRLHNMQTLKFVPVEKQVRIARETADIYCPLAQLLGIRAWYEELTDLCFQILDPVEYEFVGRKFAQTWKEQHKVLETWVAHMNDALQRHGIKAVSVELQRRHAREIRVASVEREELLQHAESFHSVLVTIRDNADCYEALGAVHAFASPLPSSISDYIAAPKVNGYQALHTVVLTSSGNPITLVLQTEEMRMHAQLGMALLYRDPSKSWQKSVPDWLEALLTLDESERDLQAFFLRVQAEIFTERSRVYLITGSDKKPVDLPAYASVLDAAYYADKNLGSRVTAASVNGKRAGLKQLVHDGDAIEFAITNGSGRRNPLDLYAVHTALGHKHLVHHLSSLSPKHRLQMGRDMLQTALNMTMDPFFSIRWQKDVARSVDGDDRILEKIGSGMIDAFLYVEERGNPEDFFLLNPDCFHLPTGVQPGMAMRYVLHASLEDLRRGQIVGLQVGPDVIDIVELSSITKSRNQGFTREIVPLQVRTDRTDFPFHFALKWTFLPDKNPLRDIAVLESFLDTPVHLLQFAETSVTLGFRTDRLRTLQIGYKYLQSLPHITDIFRLTPS